jgi:hypothetical protein
MAKYPIKCDGLKYAASLSPVLQDSSGKNLYINEDLLPLGNFEFSRYGSMGGSPVDISDDLNKEVEKLNGEGIVGLSFRISNSLFLFQNVAISGTIVSKKVSAPTPTTPSEGKKDNERKRKRKK